MSEWSKLERQRAPFYNYFQKKWAQELYKQATPYINALSDPRAVNWIDSIVSNVDYTDLFLRTWTITGSSFSKDTFAKYKKSKSDPVLDFWENYMREYALDSAGSRIVSIEATNKDAIMQSIRRSLDKSQAEGLGIEETARLMKQALKDDMYTISKYSAERIARTEIVGASNRGQLLGAQTLGYNMQKVWIATIDSATRTFNKGPFNHAIAEVVGLNDKFVQTGEPIDHPGDPTASAGNVINCRCGMAFRVL